MTPREGIYPYNQRAALTKHRWEDVDRPKYVNSEAEQVVAGEGRDKEHDEWRMLREIEAGEADVRMAEHGMMKV